MKRAKIALLVLTIALAVLVLLVWWESAWVCVRTSQRLELSESGATWWRTVCAEVAPRPREIPSDP
jgi:hypothetical protein